MEVIMKNEERDPFVVWIKRWKQRLEQTAFFLFIVLDLALILFIALSLLVQHFCKLTEELQNIPTAEAPANKTVH